MGTLIKRSSNSAVGDKILEFKHDNYMIALLSEKGLMLFSASRSYTIWQRFFCLTIIHGPMIIYSSTLFYYIWDLRGKFSEWLFINDILHSRQWSLPLSFSFSLTKNQNRITKNGQMNTKLLDVCFNFHILFSLLFLFRERVSVQLWRHAQISNAWMGQLQLSFMNHGYDPHHVNGHLLLWYSNGI